VVLDEGSAALQRYLGPGDLILGRSAAVVRPPTDFRQRQQRAAKERLVSKVDGHVNLKRHARMEIA
jgi:hypothetical protein